MASYERVIKFENEKPQGVIRLVEANGFYRAYNKSAFLFHQVIAQHKVTKKFVKNINQEIVYVGFPVDKLLELSEGKTRICDARQGVEFLGAYIKPFRTYVSSRSLRRIRNHLHAVTPRMHMQRARAVVNSSLGVLSHYDSFCVRKVLVAKSRLADFGLVSQDILRFSPNSFDWKLYRLRNFKDLKGIK